MSLTPFLLKCSGHVHHVPRRASYCNPEAVSVTSSRLKVADQQLSGSHMLPYATSCYQALGNLFSWKGETKVGLATTTHTAGSSKICSSPTPSSSATACVACHKTSQLEEGHGFDRKSDHPQMDIIGIYWHYPDKKNAIWGHTAYPISRQTQIT